MNNILPKKFVLSILLGMFFVFGGAGAASAEEPAVSGSAGYYFLIITNDATTDVSVRVSNKYSDFTSCKKDSEIAISSGGVKPAQQCSYFSSDAHAIAKGLELESSAKKVKEKDETPKELKPFKCGGWDFEVKGCFPIGVYYLIYKPTQYFLIGTGYMFDTMLNLSIRKEYISDPPFIEKSWIVVRDFSNMLFIFILIFAGVQTILDMGNWKNTIKLVIIMALLINFSLFFTKVVIDAGNILAVGVYESISTGSSSIAEGLSSGFEPLSFLGKAGEVSDPMDAIVVFLLSAVISGYAGYIFFKASLLFLGRLIAFWALMIVSPFAFISITLPKGNVFNKWLGILINQAFVAPVYLFCIYIIIQIVNAGIFDGTQMTGSWLFDKLLTPIIIGALIIFAMQQALKLATDMSGEFGKFGSDMAGKIIGTSAMIASGGVALAGRTFLGGAGALALRSGLVSSESKVGGYAKSLTQASFDVRNLGGKDSMFGKTIGGGIAKGVGSLGLGKGGGVGGVEKAEKDRIEKTLEKAKSKNMSIFEEQRIRNRAEKEAKNQQVSDNMATSRAIFSAKLERDRAAQLKEEVESAQKAHDESETAKEVEKTKAEYEETVSAITRGGGQTDANFAKRDAAKASFDKATSAHASSGTSVALQAKLDELRKAEQEADSAIENGAPSTAEGSTEKPKSAKETADSNIKKENERRRNAYAEKVSKGGWFSSSNRAAADKIRKGEDSGHEKKSKEFAAELKKEKEGKARPEVIEHIEEKIKDHKGDK